MVLIVQILLGVLTLLVLVGAFFASKFWHWAHVLVLVAFYFASVGYAVLAARSLDTRLTYQKQLTDAQKNLEQQIEINEAIVRGTNKAQLVGQLAGRGILGAQDADEFPGIGEQEHELRLINRMRGRVWREAFPQGTPDAETGAVVVGFNEKRPAGAAAEEEAIEGEEIPVEGEEAAAPAPSTPLDLEPDAIVYVFEAGPLDGAEGNASNQYIGEFRVESTDPAARSAVLQPVDHLETDPYATKRLIDSTQRQAEWVVYRTMPSDSHDLFAGMDEETLRKLLPEQVVDEYLRDMTPAEPSDPAERVVAIDAEGNVVPADEAEEKGVAKQYRRRIREYALLLNNLEAQRTTLVAQQLALESDIAKLVAANEGAKKQTAYREQELAKWQADFAAIKRENQAIGKHKTALLAQVDNARRLLNATLEQNAQLAQARLSERGNLTPIGSGALDIDAL